MGRGERDHTGRIPEDIDEIELDAEREPGQDRTLGQCGRNAGELRKTRRSSRNRPRSHRRSRRRGAARGTRRRHRPWRRRVRCRRSARSHHRQRNEYREQRPVPARRWPGRSAERSSRERRQRHRGTKQQVAQSGEGRARPGTVPTGTVCARVGPRTATTHTPIFCVISYGSGLKVACHGGVGVVPSPGCRI